jgi:hypothetical protein
MITIFNYIYKKSTKGIFLSVLFFGMLTSCDVFYEEPLTSIDEKLLWSNEDLTTSYLNYLYYLTMPVFSATSTSGYSDEITGQTSYMYGQMTTTSDFPVQSTSSYDLAYSNNTYAKIRRINLMLEKLKSSPLSSEFVNKTRAQALFLRAWVYWNLVRNYGGVSLILNTKDVFDNGEISSSVYVKRNTTSECIEQIVNDLDTAYAYLPSSWDDSEYGRITRGAAISLKGRVLLYWASPEFNPNNNQDRWTRAYEANDSALAVLQRDGFGLNPTFSGIFNEAEEKTDEAIMVRVYNKTDFIHSFDLSVRPSIGGIGTHSANPTWNFVKIFPMADGYPIDSSSSYSSKRFWLDRDPRLNLTIGYNTGSWPLGDSVNYKVWTYWYWDNTKSPVTLVSVENSNSSTTGFYCRKWVNKALNIGELNSIGTDWIEIRFAEVLLNFAECANEVGKVDEMREALYRIHQERTDVKVGMGFIDNHKNDQEFMRGVIMNERAVELAFENKRFWDLRRRNMFTSNVGNVNKLNGQRRCGLRVEFIATPQTTASTFSKIRSTINFNLAAYYNTYFKEGYNDTIDTQYPIGVQDACNFFPIPSDALNHNPNLEQNFDWGGTFDPLQ